MILSKKDAVMEYLTDLPDLVSVLTEEETKLCEIQVGKMMTDNTLPAATNDNGDGVDIIKWYSHLSKKYPTKWPCRYCTSFMDPRYNQVSVQWVM